MEVPDFVYFLETCIQEIFKKVDAFNAMTRHLNGLTIQELLTMVDTLKTKVVRTGKYERWDSSRGSVAHIKE